MAAVSQASGCAQVASPALGAGRNVERAWAGIEGAMVAAGGLLRRCRRLPPSDITDDATVDAQALTCWLRIYPSARRLHPARRWWQPRAGMRIWLCLASSVGAWGDALGVAGRAGRAGRARRVGASWRKGGRDSKTFASRPMAGTLPKAKPDVVTDQGCRGRPACAAEWLLGPDPRRILQSRKHQADPRRRALPPSTLACTEGLANHG